MQGTISSPLCKQTPTQCKTRKCKLSERHDGYSFIFLLAKQERTKKKARSTNKKAEREREREMRDEGKMAYWVGGVDGLTRSAAAWVGPWWHGLGGSVAA